ncbi:hypothetical protein NPIL_20711, partial [Nephila pilipes]
KNKVVLPAQCYRKGLLKCAMGDECENQESSRMSQRAQYRLLGSKH